MQRKLKQKSKVNKMAFSRDKFVPLSELAGVFGYTRDHLAFLCRTKALSAERVGRSWLTTHEEVARYQKQIEFIQEERWKTMSQIQKPVLSLSLARTRTLAWHKPISGGIDSALRSFGATFRGLKLILRLPLIFSFFLINKALFLVHAAFTHPITSLHELKNELAHYLDLVSLPVSDIYLKHKGRYSLYQIMGLAKFAKAVSVVAIVIFAGTSLLWFVFVNDVQILALGLTPGTFFAIMFIQQSAKGWKQKFTLLNPRGARTAKAVFNRVKNKNISFMASRKKTAVSVAKQVQPITVWQALNEPVVEVTGEAAKTIFTVAVVILLFAWLSPHFGQNAVVPEVAGVTVSKVNEPVIAEEQVQVVPQWYYTLEVVPESIEEAFVQASFEVLDISEPAAQIYEFYSPGFQALNDAWLELMQDPYLVY